MFLLNWLVQIVINWILFAINFWIEKKFFFCGVDESRYRKPDMLEHTIGRAKICRIVMFVPFVGVIIAVCYLTFTLGRLVVMQDKFKPF